MFEVLIREAAARFGLGDKALPLVQMLLAYMTNRDTGGLMGFLEKFKAAGLGPIIQSWLGGGPAAQPISNAQLETVLGASGGLLSQLTSRLGAPRDNIASALGYLLPPIVGKLTPGGSMPSGLPPEVASLSGAGQSLLTAPIVDTTVSTSSGSGGVMKWLPWIIVAAAAVLGFSYWNQHRGQDAASPVPAASATAPEAGASAPAAVDASSPAPVASEPASQAAPAAGDAASAAPAAANSAAADVPTGAAVLSVVTNDMPALKVYFDSGKTDVHADFASKSADLVAFMKANADVKAVISGFNDPTGNAAANAELSKNRAKAVQAALVAQGIAEDRTVLEKPAEATDSSDSNAASRRVEVVLRK